MKRSFNIAARFRSPLLLTGGAGALLNAALWILSLTLFPRDLPAAILHYNVGVGIDFIGEGHQILVLPVLGTALVVLDGLLAYVLRKTNYLSAAILMGAAVAAQALLLAAFTAILIMNR
ncbi:MAG: hypothetical protein HYR90_04600 [Candidatus Andersenbacteria bacterium]|nr:hypothetical protein [Candidatus Andersenbacteria bacterium]MBI3250448.1 hypothetical protein [Candidatus Andersenbacteria bacterium]